MPVTRSELLFFSAGMAAGALLHANYPKLKEAAGPLVAGALNGAGTGNPLGDRLAEVVRSVAEKIESVQDAMAEMSRTAAEASAAGTAAATADATGATASASSSRPHDVFQTANGTV